MREVSKRWLSLGLVAFASTALAETQFSSVQVKNGQMRESPTFFGKLVSPVTYGERLQVLEQQGDWSRVTTPAGQTGWIHTSALTKKKIALRAGDQNAQSGASGDELTLAGKGFNSDVEAAFKSKNQNVNFAWVDKMEKIKISPDSMQQFLAAGNVHPTEGGQR